MEVAAYRLLYDSIHDFKTTARHVEADVRRYGIQDNRTDPVPGMQGRAHHDMWVSMKTVSHFNLGIALESMLKLLLYLNRVDLPRHHLLAKLHDLLPEKYQTQLNDTYQDCRRVAPSGYELVAFLNAASPTNAPPGPPNRDISTIRGFFEYFDEDVILWQKRYSWELVEEGRWRHYLSDISVFVALVDRVMAGVPRH